MKNNTSLFKQKYQNHPNLTRASSPTPRLYFYPKLIHTRSSTPLRNTGLFHQRLAFTGHPKQPTSPSLYLTHKLSGETADGQRTTLTSNTETRRPKKIKLQKQFSPASTGSSIGQVLQWKPAEGSSLVEESPDEFLSNLANNQIFFCCSCFQYVFGIQKRRHYPECRDSLIFANFEKDQILGLCWQRIERIVELARYTSTHQKQIEDLFSEVRQCKFCRMYMINYPQNCRFFGLKQLPQAFVYTYEKLLKGRIHTSSRADLFSCF